MTKIPAYFGCICVPCRAHWKMGFLKQREARYWNRKPVNRKKTLRTHRTGK